MHISLLTLLTSSLSSLTCALNITYPTAGSTVSQSDLTITWTANSTDPTRLDIVLTNDDTDSVTLSTNISSTAHAYTVKALTLSSQAKTGSDWEVVINSAGDLGNELLAISGKFTISNSTDASPTAHTTSASSTATPAATSSGVAAALSGGQGALGAVAAGLLAFAI